MTNLFTVESRVKEFFNRSEFSEDVYMDKITVEHFVTRSDQLPDIAPT